MGRGQGWTPNDFPHVLAGELTKSGYRTHLVGKGHFNPPRASMGFESLELDESGRVLPKGFLDDYRQYFNRYAPSCITPDDHGISWNSWLARPWHTDEYLHPTAWTGTQAIRFLERRDPSRPFFLNISFARPHSPYVPPCAYWERYIDAETAPAFVGHWASMHDDPFTAASPDAWRGRMSAEEIHRSSTRRSAGCLTG